MKTQTIKFNDFMNGEHKKPKKKGKAKKVVKLASGLALPLALGSPIGLALGVTKVLASTNESVPVVTAVPVGASEWMGEKTLSALAHVLDPVVDILVALSFPVASVIIVGACFFFMLGNSEKAWSTIQNASLGYVLIQVSPLILDVLKQVGNAV
jgi:hypothetical protein